MKQTLWFQCYALVTVFHLAVCSQCGGVKAAVPFSAAGERDTWLTTHVKGTGHTVTEATEIRIVTP